MPLFTCFLKVREIINIIKAERRAEGFTEETGKIPGFTLGKIRRVFFVSAFTEGTLCGLVFSKGFTLCASPLCKCWRGALTVCWTLYRVLIYRWFLFFCKGHLQCYLYLKA